METSRLSSVVVKEQPRGVSYNRPSPGAATTSYAERLPLSVPARLESHRKDSPNYRDGCLENDFLVSTGQCRNKEALFGSRFLNKARCVIVRKCSKIPAGFPGPLGTAAPSLGKYSHLPEDPKVSVRPFKNMSFGLMTPNLSETHQSRRLSCRGTLRTSYSHLK